MTAWDGDIGSVLAYSVNSKPNNSVYSVSLYRWWTAATGTVKQKAEAAAEEIGDDVIPPMGILQQIDAEEAAKIDVEGTTVPKKK